jgi:RNA polymerase sigma factor (TIGR02999 family)
VVTPSPAGHPPAAAAAAEAADLTQLLQAWKAGDSGALGHIVGALQAEFLRMAASRLRGAGELSLSRADVVQEALLRLMRADTRWVDRAHFVATVSLTMRSVLREHARARLASRRDGGERVTLTLDGGGPAEPSMAADLLTLDALLTQLAERDPRAAQVLELTYFTGLDRAQVAAVLGLSVPTVDRELRFARAWLRDALGRELEA